MRRWLLVFLVLLLPVRGWVGEAMAGQMLQERVAQVQMAQAHGGHQQLHHVDQAHHDGSAAGTPHAHHGLVASAPADTGSAHGDCGTCAACQVCSSVALSPSVPTIPAGAFSQPRPQAIQRSFTSAEALHAFKPPRG